MINSNCDVGEYLQETCHKTSYVRNTGFKEFSEYSNEVKELLHLRLGREIGKICLHHEQVYLQKYTHLFGQICCDPFKKHNKKPIKKSLRLITLNFANLSSGLLIPGKRICPACEKCVKKSVAGIRNLQHNRQKHNSLQMMEESLIMEQETGRRPSRRAAREAAKKIYNTVRNYGCTTDTDDTEAIVTISPRKSQGIKESGTPRLVQRQRQQKSYHNIKIPPPNIDLVMECHEELLSTVQAEALLQAQLQYNMVMKTLRNLKACNNVKIIIQPADHPPPIRDSDDEDDSKSDVKCEDNSSDSKDLEISDEKSKKENGSIIPMKLSVNVSSPAPSILS